MKAIDNLLPAMPNDLDEAERRCHEMINYFHQEYERQCAPYIKILGDIAMLRPRIYVVDGKTMVPFL